ALGLTNDQDTHDTNELTLRQWVANVNGLSTTDQLEVTLEQQYGFDALTFKLFDELGVLKDTPIAIYGNKISSARILQSVIEQVWKLEEHDKDMIVMQHLVGYEYKGKQYEHESSLIVKGTDRLRSAMAQTVGLPM